VSHSQLFEYHDQINEPLCPTLLSELDQHARQVGGKIGLSLATGAPPFRYYKFHDYAAFAASRACPPDAGGCATGNEIYSPLFFHAHELAHDYVFRAWGGWSTGFLNEGEAVALSCQPLRFVAPTDRPIDVVNSVGWRELLDLSAANSKERDGYVAAGYLVTYLVAHYGWQRLAELHRRVAPGITATDFDRTFSEVFPIAMDQAWSSALDTAGAQPCFKDWLCSATPMTTGEDAPLGCDGQMHKSVTVTDQAGVELSISGGNGEITLVGGCSDAAPSWIELTGAFSTRATHWVNLKPGTYTIADLIATGGPADVVFGGYLPGGFLGSSCATAGAITLDANGDTYVDLLPGVASGWMNIVGGGGQAYVVSNYGISAGPGGALEICDGCAATATCVPLSENSMSTVALGEHAVLHLQNAIVDSGVSGPADPPPYLAFFRQRSGL
jgi:hypothetical protein